MTGVAALAGRKRLKYLRRDIAETERLIRRQLDIVVKLQWEGRDNWQSRDLLADLERMYALKIEDLERIERELSESSRRSERVLDQRS